MNTKIASCVLSLSYRDIHLAKVLKCMFSLEKYGIGVCDSVLLKVKYKIELNSLLCHTSYGRIRTLVEKEWVFKLYKGTTGKLRESSRP